MVNGIRMRFFEDRVDVGDLFKKATSKECTRSGIQPFYCKKFNTLK